MIFSFIYILLAILALSFLIFIHELGHYYMARKVGMRVETFAIGFGKPIYSWIHDGVKWQIGWILFGGYVKIAGQEVDNQNTDTSPDSFFAKSPWDRMKVAFAGPLVNLLFALLAFSLLYLAGGREKSFSEYTSIIGWVDPKSELYQQGIRPGDQLLSYDEQTFQSSKDHIYAPIVATDSIRIRGNKIDYLKGEKTPFDYAVKTYSPVGAVDRSIKTSGILGSASYIIYDKLSDGQENPLPEGSPLQDSGIQYGDRIVWVDGEPVFSVQQLNYLINSERVLLTIRRGNETLLRRVPRVLVQELKLDNEVREELIDWQFESGLNGVKIQRLFYLPYNLTNNCVVENAIKFIDKDNEDEAFPTTYSSDLEEPLQAGDTILAVAGIPVERSFQLLYQLQERKVNIIVQRLGHAFAKTSWKNADEEYFQHVDWSQLQKLVASIGSNQPVKQEGQYYLLKPVTPKTIAEFNLSEDKKTQIADQLREQRKQIEGIEDPEKRTQALNLLSLREKQLLIGLPGIQDRRVNYNPGPLEQFNNVFQEIWRTLSALVTGSLNPKWVAGPIGIVQVVQENWKLGFQEVLYWLGAISLNLGFLNLLPVPMLDGGTILFCLAEMITGKKLSPKTMEKIILPFALLLIGFFIFLTYNDLSRIFNLFLK